MNPQPASAKVSEARSRLAPRHRRTRVGRHRDTAPHHATGLYPLGQGCCSDSEPEPQLSYLLHHTNTNSSSYSSCGRSSPSLRVTRSRVFVAPEGERTHPDYFENHCSPFMNSNYAFGTCRRLIEYATAFFVASLLANYVSVCCLLSGMVASDHGFRWVGEDADESEPTTKRHLV